MAKHIFEWVIEDGRTTTVALGMVTGTCTASKQEGGIYLRVVGDSDDSAPLHIPKEYAEKFLADWGTFRGKVDAGVFLSDVHIRR